MVDRWSEGTIRNFSVHFPSTSSGMEVLAHELLSILLPGWSKWRVRAERCAKRKLRIVISTHHCHWLHIFTWITLHSAWSPTHTPSFHEPTMFGHGVMTFWPSFWGPYFLSNPTQTGRRPSLDTSCHIYQKLLLVFHFIPTTTLLKQIYLLLRVHGGKYSDGCLRV